MDWATISVIANAVLLIFEYWLGKTKKTKASSTIELILNILKTIIQRRN